MEPVKAICWGRDGRPVCPVRQQCYDHAVNEGEVGCWGGEMHDGPKIGRADREVQPVLVVVDSRPKRV